MRKYLLALSIFTAAAMISSCSNQDDQIETNTFKGIYKIESISSSVDIDLNNDGLQTVDYLQEIKSDHISYDGEVVNFGYNNDLNQNFAEASPTSQQINTTKFLNIQFPIQTIDSVYQGGETFAIMNAEYRNLNTAFIYKLKNSNVEIESDPFNQFEFTGIKNFQINRINQNEFETIFDFKIYDFKEGDWILTTLRTSYKKVQQ